MLPTDGLDNFLNIIVLESCADRDIGLKKELLDGFALALFDGRWGSAAQEN